MSQWDFPPINESVEELQARLKHEQNARWRNCLHLLLLIRSGQVKSRIQAAEHLTVHLNTVRSWLNSYDNSNSALQIEPGLTCVTIRDTVQQSERSVDA